MNLRYYEEIATYKRCERGSIPLFPSFPRTKTIFPPVFGRVPDPATALSRSCSPVVPNVFKILCEVADGDISGPRGVATSTSGRDEKK